MLRPISVDFCLTLDTNYFVQFLQIFALLFALTIGTLCCVQLLQIFALLFALTIGLYVASNFCRFLPYFSLLTIGTLCCVNFCRFLPYTLTTLFTVWYDGPNWQYQLCTADSPIVPYAKQSYESSCLFLGKVLLFLG